MSKQFGIRGNKINRLSSENIIYKVVKLGDLKQYIENDFITIPKFQRDLDIDKVEEIKNEILNDELYLVQRANPIQLGTIENNKKYKHYLIDGQHRIEVLKNMSNDYLDMDVSIVITLCKNELEVIELFKKMIRHMESYYILDESVFKKDFMMSLEFKLKEFLKEHYSNYFVRGSKNDCVYTLDNFLLELKDNNFFKKKFSNEIDMKDYIFEKFDEFNKLINYKINIKNNPTIFYKKDYDYIIKTGYKPIASKKNNFIDYLCKNDDDIINPQHFYKTIKTKITKKLKEELWKKVYGTRIRTICIISDCKNMIEKNDYQAGHIVSEFNGGSTSLENLYPICSTCNQKMSKHNWIDYDEQSYNLIKIKNKNLKSIDI